MKLRKKAIQFHTLPGSLVIYTGPYDALEPVLRRTYGDYPEFDPEPGAHARYFALTSPDTASVYIIWMEEWHPAHLVHEASHVTDHLFESLGIPPGRESTEVRAYFNAYLLAEAMKWQT